MRAPNRGLARSGLRSSTTWWRRGVNVAIDGAGGKRCATRSAHGQAMNPAQNSRSIPHVPVTLPVTDCLLSASDSLLAANRAGGLARAARHGHHDDRKRHHPGSMNRLTVYGLIGFLGVVVFTSSLIVLHVAGAEIDWTRHYVSSFANGPIGWVFVWGALVHSVGNLALTLGLRRSLDPGPLRAWAVVLLGLAAGGISVVALVPVDPAGSSLTLTGFVHRVALSVSLPVELVALFLFSIAFRRDRQWRRRSGLSFVLSTIAASALAGFLLAIRLDQTPAVAERLALARVMAWEFWAAFHLVRHSTVLEFGASR